MGYDYLLFITHCIILLPIVYNVTMQKLYLLIAVWKNRGCQCSFRLLMMGGVSPETCWASYKYGIINFWYIVASCWIFLYEPTWYLACTIAFHNGDQLFFLWGTSWGQRNSCWSEWHYKDCRLCDVCAEAT